MRRSPSSSSIAGSQPRIASGLRDVRLAHLRIVLGAHVFVDDPGLVAGESIDDLGELLDGELARIADVDRIGLIGKQQPVDPLDQIIDILERARLQAVAVDGERLAAQRLLDEVRDTPAAGGTGHDLGGDDGPGDHGGRLDGTQSLDRSSAGAAHS